MTKAQHRPLRSDAERTVRTILEAAERVFSANSAATVEQVAEAAGVARSTVHRRFATREALLDALAAWATEQFHAAVDAARPESTPPLVALYQVTVNVLRVKLDWRFAMDLGAGTDPTAAAVNATVLARCDDLLRRTRDAGLLRADVDLLWARRVYHALVHEAGHGGDGTDDPHALATTILQTMFHGLGTPAARL